MDIVKRFVVTGFSSSQTPYVVFYFIGLCIFKYVRQIFVFVLNQIWVVFVLRISRIRDWVGRCNEEIAGIFFISFQNDGNAFGADGLDGSFIVNGTVFVGIGEAGADYIVIVVHSIFDIE